MNKRHTRVPIPSLPQSFRQTLCYGTARLRHISGKSTISYVMMILFILSPVVDTLIETGMASPGDASSHHSDAQSSDLASDSARDSQHPHQNDTDCPSTHNHTHCDCLCCPGHLLAMAAHTTCRTGDFVPLDSIVPSTPYSKRLPAGIQANIYRPPQTPATLFTA